jgi:hypothetical protein
MSKHNFYEITIASESKRCILTYRLESHRVAQQWAEQISQCNPSQLRDSLDPWRGIIRNWDSKILELDNLITDLNVWLPEKIEGYWNNLDPEESLNRLHVHFPNQERVETDISKRKQLTVYNDLIHELQFLYNVKKKKKEFMYLLLCPNSHRSSWEEIQIDDYKLFSPNLNFGDLVLHYPHVGRHPLELYISKDTDCPADQILPQHSISPFHTLRFFDIRVSSQEFENFYSSSGLVWPYAPQDPRLAVGYINLGKLEYVDQQPWTRSVTNTLVRSCDHIVDWTVY